MNYIKQLQKENLELRIEMIGLKCGLNDLQGYLHSSKFHVDTTVQVDDVLRRLQEAFNQADRLLYEQQQIS